MKVAVYPGSFNPWHIGHEDILRKALKVFDKVIVAIGINPEKPNNGSEDAVFEGLICGFKDDWHKERIEIKTFDTLLSTFVENVNADVVIRGLRNGHDLQYEMNQQYWNEDLGLKVPIVYFICDRELSHISSSTIRALKGFRK